MTRTALETGSVGTQSQSDEVNQSPPIVPGVREAVERLRVCADVADYVDAMDGERDETHGLAMVRPQDLRTLLNAFRGSGHE